MTDLKEQTENAMTAGFEGRVFRSLLMHKLRSSDISLNPHELARVADRVAKDIKTDRGAVLTILSALLQDILEDSIAKARVASPSSGH